MCDPLTTCPTYTRVYMRALSGERGGGARQFLALTQRLGIKLKREELLQMVARVDADGSGELDFEEFVSLVNSASEQLLEVLIPLP